MKLFGVFGAEPTPVEAAEHRVRVMQERRTRLATQVADAQRELTQRKDAATTAALDHGSDIDEHGAEIASQAATCDALTAALDTAQRELTEAQAALAHEQDQAERARSVAEIETLRQDMIAPFEQLIAAIATLLPLAKRGADFNPDVAQVAGLLSQWSIDGPQAARVTTTALDHHAQSIRSGVGRATLPASAEAKPRATSASPVARAAVVKHDVRWSENGPTRFCRAFWDAPLPPTLFERAIAHNIAVDASSDDAMKLRRQRLATANAVDLDRCVDLDVDPPEMPPPRGDVWIHPHGTPKWQPPIQTSAPLTAWVGSRPPTNGGGDY
jgi:hypothetical protein